MNGKWMAGRDGRTHYYLEGEALCGSAAEAVGPAPVRQERGQRPGIHPLPDNRADCPQCKTRHTDRWVTAGRPV